MRRDIAVADGGHCHDRPVHRDWNAGVAVVRPFDHIHHGTEHQNEHQDDGKKNQYLATAGAQCLCQRSVFRNIHREFENPENAQQAQDPHIQQDIGFRKNQRDIGWQNRQ